MDLSSTKSKLLVGFVVLDVLALNIAAGYLFYKSEIRSRSATSSISKSETNFNSPIVQNVDQCGEDCRAYIDSKMTKPSSSPTPIPTPTPPAKQGKALPGKTKTRTVSYVTVPGSGSTMANDWTIVSGSDFYFNPADYPGLVAVYFEVNMKLMTGSGMAYVRLYDSTHGIGVQGSDASTKAGTDTVVESGNISFWQGKNLIKVQIKSLTAESAIYNSGRLRIVTEN